MKQILLFLLFPVFLFGQKTQVLTDSKFELTVVGDYIVEQDTSDSGVISLTFTPTISLRKEIESKLNTINTEIDQLSQQVIEIEAHQVNLRRERKDLEHILDKITKQQKMPAAPKSKKGKS